MSGIYCQLGDYILPTTFYKNRFDQQILWFPGFSVHNFHQYDISYIFRHAWQGAGGSIYHSMDPGNEPDRKVMLGWNDDAFCPWLVKAGSCERLARQTWQKKNPLRHVDMECPSSPTPTPDGPAPAPDVADLTGDYPDDQGARCLDDLFIFTFCVFQNVWCFFVFL